MNDERKLLMKLSEGERAACKKVLWEEARSNALACRACPLADTRAKVVFGDGDPDSKLLFIGEGPGADEDAQGLPFVGKAGQLLTQILTAAGISRKEVYITNIVKCRPPENRVPSPQETVICDRHLQTQIMLIDPLLIVLLGNTPMRWILQTNEGITKLRGRWFEWRGVAVMPMFHPSYLLRNQSREKGSPKSLTWIDIQEVKRRWEEVKTAGKLSEDIFVGGRA
ncbi:uracil-DNA glycosylase [Synergistes jonesii]|uniref:uracil-DNA glycosylase n=1 Tax=Synergistes jonesii TaxID=2754 RepID=UPI003327BEB7